MASGGQRQVEEAEFHPGELCSGRGARAAQGFSASAGDEPMGGLAVLVQVPEVVFVAAEAGLDVILREELAPPAEHFAPREA